MRTGTKLFISPSACPFWNKAISFRKRVAFLVQISFIFPLETFHWSFLLHRAVHIVCLRGTVKPIYVESRYCRRKARPSRLYSISTSPRCRITLSGLDGTIPNHSPNPSFYVRMYASFPASPVYYGTLHRSNSFAHYTSQCVIHDIQRWYALGKL